MSGRKRKISINLTDLPDVLLGHVVRLLGDRDYRGVAGTCHRLKKVHEEVFDTCKTSAEEMVLTVSGAELFCSEAKSQSRFCIIREDMSSFVWSLTRKKVSPLECVRDTAALHGRLEVLKWAVVVRGCPLSDRRTSALAACSGNLSVLQWLRANACPWDSVTCKAAAIHGNLTMLQWAHANGCPWNEDTCSGAAVKGDLTMLKWARASGCPWDKKTCFRAALNGHLTLLQWARAHGCPWDEETCSSASFSGHLDILKWARANGCPWDHRTCLNAVTNERIAVLHWIRANGGPEEWFVHSYVKKRLSRHSE